MCLLNKRSERRQSEKEDSKYMIFRRKQNQGLGEPRVDEWVEHTKLQCGETILGDTVMVDTYHSLVKCHRI